MSIDREFSRKFSTSVILHGLISKKWVKSVVDIHLAHGGFTLEAHISVFQYDFIITFKSGYDLHLLNSKKQTIFLHYVTPKGHSKCMSLAYGRGGLAKKMTKCGIWGRVYAKE